MIRAILFDLDGVLVDACQWHYDALNTALQIHCNYTIDYKTHMEYFNGRTTKTKLRMLCQRGIITESDIDLIYHTKQLLTVKQIMECGHIDSDKQKLHKYLKSRGILIGCVTNSIRSTAELMLQVTGQLEYMDILVSNEDVTRHKPDPYPYQYAIQQLNIFADRALIVEDSDIGIQSAIYSGANYLRVHSVKEVNINTLATEIERINKWNEIGL